MSNCPFCQVRLDDRDVLSGICPHCRQSLPAALREHASAAADTRGVSGQIERQVSQIWEGRIGPDAGTTTSLKSAAATVEAGPSVLIRPRVIRDESGIAESQADYEVQGQLGQGGMGVVLAARQASINRTVAVKMLSPQKADDESSRQKFLSEAVVTGDLEHPNIVPIYDLGQDQSGALFYAMKRVKGRPWDMVIRRRTLDENLEILMKVSDAVAFAHSRGVVHRDLKPENVMLGDFGEVLLMDWGLALSVADAASNDVVAGSPAYMAPEMALGQMGQVGIASDIYLLGAILFEIVAGGPPHTGSTVLECLSAAARNEIWPTEESGELLEIARRALATRPEDRFATVGELQQAIRAYRSHLQSINLSERAESDLASAVRRRSLRDLCPSALRFSRSLPRCGMAIVQRRTAAAGRVRPMPKALCERAISTWGHRSWTPLTSTTPTSWNVSGKRSANATRGSSGCALPSG